MLTSTTLNNALLGPLGFLSDVFGTGRAASFISSETFIVPAGINRLRVSVYGAGGAGGAISQQYRCSGAGGGGFARKTISVNSGEEYAIITGFGGIAVTNNEGGAGGTSSFGTILSATGGSGGKISNATEVVLGGFGGIGVGGDINLNGGNGGDIAAYSSGYLATGGGGAGTIMGKGGNGGDIYGGSSSGTYQATGGGSTGGNGGNIDRDLVGNGNYATGGAGSLSGAIGNSSQTSGQGHLGTASAIRLASDATGVALDNIEYPTLDYVSRFIGEFIYSNGQAGMLYSSSLTVNNPKIGGASGGTVMNSGFVRGADAGSFAGSGGTSSSSASSSVGAGGLCAGSGGLSNAAICKNGGSGLVTIEW
jgi:hypothetical protein